MPSNNSTWFLHFFNYTEIQFEWQGVEPVAKESGTPPEVNMEKTLTGYKKPKEQETVDKLPKTYQQAPVQIPPIFDGSQMLVLGLFQNEIPTGVHISGKSPDGPLTLDIPVS